MTGAPSKSLRATAASHRLRWSLLAIYPSEPVKATALFCILHSDFCISLPTQFDFPAARGYSCGHDANDTRIVVGALPKVLFPLPRSRPGPGHQPHEFPGRFPPLHGAAHGKGLCQHGRFGTRRHRQSRRKTHGRPLLATQSRAGPAARHPPADRGRHPRRQGFRPPGPFGRDSRRARAVQEPSGHWHRRLGFGAAVRRQRPQPARH
jgi:hypothetical protein